MSDDVLITPASRKIEFKDSAGNVDGKIELDTNGNLNITSPGGDIALGDTTADVFIGDGTNNVDIVFEQNGEIRALTGKTLTIGQADSDVTVAAQNFSVTGATTLGTITDSLFIRRANVGGVQLVLHADTTTVPTASIALMRGTDDTYGTDAYVDYTIVNGYGSSGSDGGTLSIARTVDGNASTYLVDFDDHTTLLTDVVFQKAIVEKAYNLTGTALDPSNGTLQYKTLGSNTTFTESFVDGESITLMIDDGSGYTVTWPTMTWASGSAPTLATSGYTTVVLWHRGGLYGAVVS